MATAILGPIIGALAPHLLNYLFKGNETWNGEGPKQTGNIQGYDYNQDPQVQNVMKLWNQSPYNQPFNPQQANQQFNEQVADPSTKYYQERIQPQTRNQFFQPSGVGTTAMQKALTQDAEDLGGSLAGLRSNYLQSQQDTHGKNQYNLIAQQLGLSNNRAGQNQPVIQGAQAGFGSQFGPILQQVLGNLFSQGGQPGSNQQPGQNQPQMPWEVPGQLSGQSNQWSM